MNERDALEWLGLADRPQDEEEILEALDEQLFIVRKEALAKYMVPALLNKQIRVAKHLSDARSLLLKAEAIVDPPNEHSVQWSFNSWLEFLTGYEKARAEAFLFLTRSRTPASLLMALQHVLYVQVFYQDAFLDLSKDLDISEIDTVNSREILDSGSIILRLKQGVDLALLADVLGKERRRIVGLPAYS